MACAATSSVGVASSSAAPLMVSASSSSSSASFGRHASVVLPRGYSGLDESFPSRCRLASSSRSTFFASKTPLSFSSTDSRGRACRRLVVSAVSAIASALLCPELQLILHPAVASSSSAIHGILTADHLPLVGNIAPDFEAEAVFDQEFVKIKLSEYIGKKYVVVFFYPLDFTFVCPTEITAFSDKYSEFEKLNTEVIAISTDSVFSHLAWIQTDRKSGGLGDLKYPLVSDLTKKISKDFNVLIADQKPGEPLPGGIPLVGGVVKPVGIALRGLFIIDKEGVIQHATINNLAIGRSVEETLRTLQAVQYVQENPDEVCPAGWKPGEKTMKPDSKLSKEYFAAVSV